MEVKVVRLGVKFKARKFESGFEQGCLEGLNME